MDRAAMAPRARDADERTHQPAQAPATPTDGGVAELRALGAALGNSTTIALLQRRALEVGAADDPAEREADQVAAQVMATLADAEAPRTDAAVDATTPAPTRRRARAGSLPVPGHDAPGHGAGGGPAHPEVAAAIDAARGGGSELPASVRRPIEAAMGADLGGVRIHADAQAAQLSRSLNAEAFTTGRDIFFGKGAYRPGTAAGTELLSHELAHVVQQSGTAHRKLRRELVRDRVYSNTEFANATPAPQPGSPLAAGFANVLASLQDLDTKHAYIFHARNRVEDPALSNQTFGRRLRNLKELSEGSDRALASIKRATTGTEQLIAQMEGDRPGLGAKVKGLFNKRAKREKASLLATLQTLHLQLVRRHEQVRAEGEQVRAKRIEMKKQEMLAEEESKGQRETAKDEARHGTFGMYKGRVNNANFGSGATGSVAQVDYKDEKGKILKGVFKAEPETLPDAAYDMKSTGTSEESPNFALRAVAASRLNDLFGLKVIPRTELAFHEQFGFGQVMKLAAGQSPQSTEKIEIQDADEEKIKKIEEELLREGSKSEVVRRKDVSGEVKAYIEEKVTYETDWDHPILKRQLCDLQLLDALIRNIDRHVENYFIQVDQFGNPIGVLGIDNDLAFARDENDPTYVPNMSGHSTGMPPGINADTAEKFCSVTEAQVRKAVQGLLNTLETDSLVGRLKIIQAKLSEKANGAYVIPRIGNDLEGAKQWTELKDPENIKGAYFSRERGWQQGVMKQEGRLLKPGHAMLYKERRLAQLIEAVEAKQAS